MCVVNGICVKIRLLLISCRAEALALRTLLSVRPGRRNCGNEDHEDEGPGLRRLQRACWRHQRTEATARLPLLQQTHGKSGEETRCLCASEQRALTDWRPVVVFQRIQYAKTDSDVIAKVKGAYGDKEKKKDKKKKALEPAAIMAKKPASVSDT